MLKKNSFIIGSKPTECYKEINAIDVGVCFRSKSLAFPFEWTVLSSSSRESSCVTELVRSWQRRKLHANSVWPLKDNGGKDIARNIFYTCVCLAPAHTWQTLFPKFNPWCSLTSPLTESPQASKWANQVISPLILTWWSSQYFRLCLHSTQKPTRFSYWAEKTLLESPGAQGWQTWPFWNVTSRFLTRSLTKSCPQGFF